MNLKLKLIPHDRSHYPPPGGHSKCGIETCLKSEQLVEAHRLKYNYSKTYPKPYFYNGSSESDFIDSKKTYLVYIDNDWLDSGGWYMGHFSKVNFGWSFSGWDAPIQLSNIWLVYEVFGLPSSIGDPNKPHPEPECNCGCEENGNHMDDSNPCTNCAKNCATNRLALEHSIE